MQLLNEETPAVLAIPLLSSALFFEFKVLEKIHKQPTRLVIIKTIFLRVVIRIKQEKTLPHFFWWGARVWELWRLIESHPSSEDNCSGLLLPRKWSMQLLELEMEYGFQAIPSVNNVQDPDTQSYVGVFHLCDE